MLLVCSAIVYKRRFGVHCNWADSRGKTFIYLKRISNIHVLHKTNCWRKTCNFINRHYNVKKALFNINNDIFADGYEYAHENSAKKRCSLGYKGKCLYILQYYNGIFFKSSIYLKLLNFILIFKWYEHDECKTLRQPSIFVVVLNVVAIPEWTIRHKTSFGRLIYIMLFIKRQMLNIFQKDKQKMFFFLI